MARVSSHNIPNIIISSHIGGFIMNRTIEYFKLRIHMLEERNALENQRIINKLKRKVRAMESKENTGRE